MVTFHIPAGPMNLSPIFGSVDFNQVEEYYIEINGLGGVIATSPVYKRSCCCNEDTIRLFFVNYLGGIDAVNFKRTLEELEAKSESWKKSLPYPMQKWDGGAQRFNVQSNEVVTAETACFQEEDQDWLKELVSTPNAWIQWIGTQSQSDDYLPVVIADGKFVTRKIEGRYTYVLEIQFRFANENITVRN